LLRRVPAAWMLVYIAALAVAAWWYRDALNPDGVAYLRLAEHWATGNFSLAISGYWGPLLSALIAIGLLLGLDPLISARVVMALSAMLFLGSCQMVFRSFALQARFHRLALWPAAVVSIYWSVENITPDLLMASCLGVGYVQLRSSADRHRPGAGLMAGFFMGLGYLAKAIALPFAILLLLLWSGRALIAKQKTGRSRKAVLTSAAWALMALAIVGGSWVALLAQKYGRPTFSTSAQLNHAMAGPPDIERFYPFERGLHDPPPGRITFWEDPDLPYPDWSPFSSV
jgi:hypothetical protein